MTVSFDEMSGSARLWVYQSDRKLSTKEQVQIREALSPFLENWAAHGHQLQCAGEVLHDHFLVLAVDESAQGASGCSIDTSVKFIKSLEAQLNLNFFDRTRVALDTKVEGVRLATMGEIPDLIAQGLLEQDTHIFNNVVSSKAEWEKNWLQPASESWIKRYFSA